MKIEAVRQLPSGDRFCYWIKEREQVRLRKIAGEPPPWTDDAILQSYRFTNVVRIEDKVSQWLLHHWYEPYRDHPNIVVACALARFLNKIETLEVVGFPERWRPAAVKKKLRRLRDGGATVFNAAYIIRGNDGIDKIEAVVDHYVNPLYRRPLEIDRSSMQRTWVALAERHGYGSFMAGQVAADLRWAIDHQWADVETWAPLGPGSRRGLNRLLERPPETPVSQGDFEEYLSAIIATYAGGLPAELTERMEAMDYQSALCELSKYDKTLFGEGRPKQLYNGRGNKCLS